MQAHLGEIILGILLSAFFTLIWRRLDSIEGRITSFQTETNGHFATVEAELRFFHGETGKLGGRVDELSKRVR